MRPSRYRGVGKTQKEINDVLDKIRAEIKQEYKVECENYYGQGLKRTIEIIDKYKAESEG